MASLTSILVDQSEWESVVALIVVPRLKYHPTTRKGPATVQKTRGDLLGWSVGLGVTDKDGIRFEFSAWVYSASMPDLSAGEEVEISALRASPWGFAARSGFAFEADSIVAKRGE